MKIGLQMVILVGVATGAGLVGYWLGHRSAAGHEEEATTQPSTQKSAIATVQTSPIKEGSITQTIKAYGSVIAQPGEVRIISVPFESRIGHVMVAAGQQVSAKQVLVELDASPDTQLQLQEARNAVSAAERDAQQTQMRFEQHLATNQELSVAQQTSQNAKLKLDSLEKRGAGSVQKLISEGAGIVSKISVQEGQIVPAGGSLVEIAAEKRIEVKLGIEPGDARHLEPEQEVTLVAVDDKSAEAVKGHVRLVTQRVNPDTRTVDVFISIPADSALVLEGFVRAELGIETKKGLIVPRQAVLPDDEKQVLYTVEEGKAVKHEVSIGLVNDKEIEVRGDGLKAGQQAVVLGNYELEDGMAVTVESAP